MCRRLILGLGVLLLLFSISRFVVREVGVGGKLAVRGARLPQQQGLVLLASPWWTGASGLSLVAWCLWPVPDELVPLACPSWPVASGLSLASALASPCKTSTRVFAVKQF